MAFPAQQVYRDLLRTVRKHTKGDHFSAFICHKFRDTTSKDTSALERNLALAKDYSNLVKSIHAHKELLISYNIGLDREVDQTARLKDTANRVGLSLPKLYEESK